MTPGTSPSTSPPGLMGSGHAQEASACPSHALPGSLSSQVCARLEPQPLAASVGAALATYAPSAFRPSSSGSLAMLAAMRRASSRVSNANYHSGFGFHSRASFCASAICAGVILEATLPRAAAALFERSPPPLSACAAAKLYHMCATT